MLLPFSLALAIILPLVNGRNLFNHDAVEHVPGPNIAPKLALRPRTICNDSRLSSGLAAQLASLVVPLCNVTECEDPEQDIVALENEDRSSSGPENDSSPDSRPERPHSDVHASEGSGPRTDTGSGPSAGNGSDIIEEFDRRYPWSRLSIPGDGRNCSYSF